MNSAIDCQTREHVSFDQLHANGYGPYLIPIIPPDGNLSPQSRIPAEARGKIPGKLNANGDWAGFDWLQAKATASARTAWESSGAGIGLRTGRLVALDIDVTDKLAADAVVQVAWEALGVAPLRLGAAPKCVLLYRMAEGEEPATWRYLRFQWAGAQHGVEVRGQGQQVVAYGQHPSGAAYRWPKDNPGTLPFDQLPAITAEALKEFFDAAADVLELLGADDVGFTSSAGAGGKLAADRQAVDQHDLAAKDPSFCALAVGALPNDYPDRSDYIKIGCAIKAAFAADEERGLDVFKGWCERWTEGENDLAVVEADWNRMHPPFELGASWLYEQARIRGGFNDAAAVFEPKPKAGGVDEDDATDHDVPLPKPGRTGVEFWDRYVYVEEVSRFLDTQDFTLLSERQFASRWIGRVGDSLQGKDSAPAVYLSMHDKRRVVWKLTYRPMASQFLWEDGMPAVNAFKPGPAHDLADGWRWDTARDADVQPWLELAETLVPDDYERNTLLDWLAWQIQRPGDKCSWHPILWGEQGIGKDTLLVPLMRGLGSNAATLEASALQEVYTDWAQNRSLVVIEEVHTFERRSVMDKLKPLLAAPPEKINIRKMYMAPWSVPNLVNCFFLSNHPDALSLERSDRRLLVLASPAQQGDMDAAFFTSLYKWFDEPDAAGLTGCGKVCAWLGQRDLAGFNAKGNAPRTEAKREMQGLSLGVVESEIEEAVAAGDGPFARDLVTLEEAMEWLRDRLGQAGARMSLKRLGVVFKAMKFANLGQYRVGNTLSRGRGPRVRRRIWAVRRQSTYMREAADGEGRIGELYRDQINKLADEDAARAFARPG